MIKNFVYPILFILMIPASLAASIYDLSLETSIPQNYKEVYAGEDLVVEITLNDLSKDQKEGVDVLITCFIKNIDGNIITQSAETAGFFSKLTTVKNINIPKNTKPGTYIMEVEMGYNGVKIYGKEIFQVKERALIEKESSINFISFAIPLLIILFIIFIYLEYKWFKSNRNKISGDQFKEAGFIR